ncbi:MAG: YpdA family putative bacillithiol disulfide reductase [Balneolales bacterium]
MVVIIGSGPIGLACGIELKKQNIPFVIIEKGCLVNSIYNYPVNMTFFSTSERLEIGGIPFISHGVKPTRREALEYYRRVTQSFELPVHLYETVESVDQDNGAFVVHTDKGEYEATDVVIATGFYDKIRRMNVPGEDLDKVKHYYDEPHPYFGKNVLVVGGGNSGVDVALETYRCGSDVSMVVKNAELKPGVKYWVRPDIENRIKEGEIKGYFNTEVVEIKPGEVVLHTPDGEKNIKNDFVLAMTGYQPDYSLLDHVGLKYETDEYQTPVINPETQESSIPGVYLAGVVCGGKNTGRWFIENTRVHGEAIARSIEMGRGETYCLTSSQK